MAGSRYEPLAKLRYVGYAHYFNIHDLVINTIHSHVYKYDGVHVDVYN